MFQEQTTDLITQSPLWIVTQIPTLNDFVAYLQHLRLQILEDDQSEYELRFSRAHLRAVQNVFNTMLLKGEEKLHQLSQLFCYTFLHSYRLQSEVIGEIETTKKRFTITQPISTDELFSTTDIDLGNRLLSKFQYRDDEHLSRVTLIANMVDYQPTETNEYGVHKIRSRIKAEEELWNKVVDAIFDIDNIIERDKQLRPLNRYVKDVFGIKIVVDQKQDVYLVQETLENLHWPDIVLRQFHIDPQSNTRKLDFIERKDYLANGKMSGWQAMKSVVRWADKTFEIQIQTLGNYMREREYLTDESHASFKARREQVREQVAQKIPLFRFYRDLLNWLFLGPHNSPPAYKGVRVYLAD